MIKDMISLLIYTEYIQGLIINKKYSSLKLTIYNNHNHNHNHNDNHNLYIKINKLLNNV